MYYYVDHVLWPIVFGQFYMGLGYGFGRACPRNSVMSYAVWFWPKVSGWMELSIIWKSFEFVLFEIFYQWNHKSIQASFIYDNSNVFKNHILFVFTKMSLERFISTGEPLSSATSSIKIAVHQILCSQGFGLGSKLLFDWAQFTGFSQSL